MPNKTKPSGPDLSRVKWKRFRGHHTGVTLPAAYTAGGFDGAGQPKERGDYYSSDETHTRTVVDSTHMQTSEQMLGLFGDHVQYVYFRHDPQMPDVHMIMVAVEIRK